MKNYFVAAAMYKKQEEYHFLLVHPSRLDNPYVTSDPCGVPLTSHHSHCYKVIDNGDSFTLVMKQRNEIGEIGSKATSPEVYTLTPSHVQYAGLKTKIDELNKE